MPKKVHLPELTAQDHNIVRHIPQAGHGVPLPWGDSLAA